MGSIRGIARELRRNQTPQEAKVWRFLRNRKVGLKWRRQFPIEFANDAKNGVMIYVLDFYCMELKVAIEIDGGYHQAVKYNDASRDKVLKEMGIRVFRFSNESIDRDFNSLIDLIDTLSP